MKVFQFLFSLRRKFSYPRDQVASNDSEGVEISHGEVYTRSRSKFRAGAYV